MLIIWCGAKMPDIRNTIGEVISHQEVPHKIYTDLTTFPPVEEGDVVLACGTKVLELLMDFGHVPKKRTVTSMRGKELKINGISLFATFDPGIISRDYERVPDIKWDTQLAIRKHNTGTTEPETGVYRFVESLHELIERIEEKYEATKAPVDVSCDLETLGLDEYDPEAWIISASFTVDKGKSDLLYFEKGETLVAPPSFLDIDGMDYWQALWEQVNWILTTPKVSIRGANFKYDSRWMFQKWGIYCTNHKFDTLLAGSLLDENRSNSLKLHAKIYTTMGGYDDVLDRYDMGRMDLVPKDVLLSYAGGDTDATLRVANVLKRELLKDGRLANFYVKLLHPSSKVFEKLERNGVLVDKEYYEALRTEVEAACYGLQHEMVGLLTPQIRAKYADKIEACFDQGKSPLTPALMTDFMFSTDGLNLKPKMFTEKEKKPSTSVDHLMMFQDDPVAINFINKFKEHGSAAKTLSTYIIGFMEHLRSDGRWHPHYMLFRGGYGDDDKDAGAVTGRTSCKDPAMQTIPKHTVWTKKLRRAIIAPLGKAILQLDYSQGELKITACLANEETMLNAYLNGADLHAITAARLNGYELEEFMALPEDLRDELRSGGKAGNFGLIYGMGAEGYRIYAQNSYGVVLTPEEAIQQRDSFFDLYYRLTEWHEEYKAIAHSTGRIVSPLGRVRHLPLINSSDNSARSQAERQAVNSPVQSCLSDMMQLAMVLIDREYGDQVEMCMMTHDSVAMYVPEDETVLWAKRCKNIMENLPLKRDFGWDHQLQFTVDAEVSIPDDQGVHSLAALKKMKNL